MHGVTTITVVYLYVGLTAGREITAGHRTCPVKLASCPVNLMLQNNFVWTLSAHKHYPS